MQDTDTERMFGTRIFDNDRAESVVRKLTYLLVNGPRVEVGGVEFGAFSGPSG